MNDTSEFELTKKIPQLLEEIEREQHKNPLCKLIIDSFCSVIDREKINFCVFSFSKKDDDLSQWRAYADENGFCLKFDAEKLNYSRRDESHFKAGLDECIYGDCPEVKDELKKLYDEAKDFSKKYHGKSINDVSDKFFNSEKVLKNFEKIISLASLRKDKSFEDEQEWRLMGVIKDRSCKYYANRRHIVPCGHIKLREEALVSVKLGPNNDNFKNVKHLLKNRGFSAGVEVSTIPYRAK